MFNKVNVPELQLALRKAVLARYGRYNGIDCIGCAAIFEDGQEPKFPGLSGIIHGIQALGLDLAQVDCVIGTDLVNGIWSNSTHGACITPHAFLAVIKTLLILKNHEL